MNEEMTSLMHKHLNGALTPAEASALAHALTENPHLAEEFAAMTRLDGDLSAAMKDSGRTALYTRRMERAAAETEPAAARKRWPVKSMAAAAGFAVLVGAGWSVLDGLEQNPATRSKTGSSGTGGGYASMGGGPGREGESSTMKQKLRRFFIPVPTVRSQPVSQALANLQTQWRDASPKDDKQAAAFTFALSEKVRQRWLKPDDEPIVSLEIPGVSMLTNLELVAAQSGLKPVITAAGVTMEDDPRAADTKERTWTIPLPKATIASFMQKSAQEIAWWKLTTGRNTNFSFSLAQAANAMDLAWGRSQLHYGDARGEQLNTWMDGRAPETDAGSTLLSRLQTSQFFLTKSTDGPVEAMWATPTIAMAPENQKQETAAKEVQPPFLEEVSGPGNDPSRVGRYENAYRAQFSAPGDSIVTTLDQKPENFPLVDFSPDGAKFWDATAGALAAEVQLGPTVDGDVVVSGSPVSASTSAGIAPNNINSLVQNESARELERIFRSDVDASAGMYFLPQGVVGSRNIDPANVIRLLTAHGMPAEGAAWDAETGVLTAKGTMRGLRAANAAAVAIQEAASDGVAAEMKIIEWKKGDPSIAAPTEGMVPWISSSDMQTLLKSPDKSLRIADRASAGMGRELVIDHAPPPPPEGDERAANEAPPHLTLKVSDTRRLAGESIVVRISINRVGDGISPKSISLPMTSGGWLRFDFSASGDKKAVTALVRLQTTTVDP